MVTYTLLLVFALALVVQFYYLIIYFLKLAKYEPSIPNADIHHPVSVIISAHNEYENLKKLVPILLSQNYHNYEIIIVNDRSYDDTEDYLKEKAEVFKDKIKLVTVTDIPANMDPKKYCLTLGIKAAKHDYLLFTDADCMPYNNNWILNMQSVASKEPSIVLGVSQYNIQNGILNYFIRFETFFTAVKYLSFALKGKPYMGVGRNLMYHKSIFFDNKGFHPHMNITGGDDDLFINKVANKNNTNINISIESQNFSIPKNTFSEWFIQKTRHLSVGKHYSSNIKSSLFLLYFSNILVIFLACVLLFQYEIYIYIVYALCARWLLMLIIYRLIAKKIRYNLNTWLIPVVDIIYPIYLMIIGSYSRFSRKVKWK